MMSSPTVTLFTEQVDPSRRPASLLASAAIHAGVIGLISFGILYSPKVQIRPNEHLMVRQLDLRRPAPARQSAIQGIVYPGSRPAAAGKSSPRSPALMETAHARPGPQTLVQPDLAERLAVHEEIPIPQVLIWTPKIRVVKKIVAPKPEPPTVSQAKPSFDAPNQEVNVSDVDIASSPVAKQKLQILPSTSSPVVVQNISPVELPPATVSQLDEQPTPTALLSLSNLHMQGTATLPPVNESARANVKGVLTPSTAKAGAGQGTGSSSGNAAGAGSGQAAAGAAKPSGPPGQPNGAAAGPAQGADSSQGDESSATDITLPKNGQFGSVVVGDELQDEYPELAGAWNGRMAYTVFLHVGLARSWILQYSLPTDATIAMNGNSARLEAPWPYSIVRPNLAPGAIDADALMVHGFVDTAGRFETLSIVFPEAFPQAQFVLRSLERWQFRPATENGQIARVEVLLIIPESLE